MAQELMNYSTKKELIGCQIDDISEHFAGAVASVEMMSVVSVVGNGVDGDISSQYGHYHRRRVFPNPFHFYLLHLEVQQHQVSDSGADRPRL